MPAAKTALIVLAPGFEEIEAITPMDILRRAGVELTIASLEADTEVPGKNGITVVAEATLEAALREDYDALVLPGGPGTAKLRGDSRVLEAVRARQAAGRLTAAICAAPTVLHEAGVLAGHRHTAHFSVIEELTEADEAATVVHDGHLLTSRGAGTATEFALALVATLCGEEEAGEVARAICWPHGLPLSVAGGGRE